MAGGGTKKGHVHGQTDDFCYNVVKDPVHVRDFNATVLHLLGVNHEKLTFKFQGLAQKLTGVVPAKIVPDLIA
jgi:arylsulfatase A-like enzyme